MKKSIVIVLASVLMLSSCGTYAGYGAGEGAYFGSLLGSAIGGITGGHRGHDVGTLIGMAGGAIIGAAIGSAADEQIAEDRAYDMEQYRMEKHRLAAKRKARAYNETQNGVSYEQSGLDDSGFTQDNSANDIVDIDFGTADDAQSSLSEITSSELTVCNAYFLDSDNNQLITRGEKCDIVFEIFNSGNCVAYNIEPTVTEVTGNKHVLVSPSILVESLAPQKGVKYTAHVVADKLLRDGEVKFVVNVVQNGRIVSKNVGFTLKTAKRAI